MEVAVHKIVKPGTKAAKFPPPHRLEHPNVLRVIDSWEEEDAVYYVTEILTAGTLEGYIKRIKENVRPRIIRKWCYQILEGLRHMHELDEPLPHGDVRLANIYINGETGDVRLGSFQFATRATASGTPTDRGRFLPPEWKEATPEGDIYSFGLCVLQMLTQEVPYWYTRGESYKDIMDAKKSGMLPKTLDQFELRDDVRDLILQCIAVLPEDRPTASQLLEHRFFARRTDEPNLSTPPGGGGGEAAPSGGGRTRRPPPASGGPRASPAPSPADAPSPVPTTAPAPVPAPAAPAARPAGRAEDAPSPVPGGQDGAGGGGEEKPAAGDKAAAAAAERAARKRGQRGQPGAVNTMEVVRAPGPDRALPKLHGVTFEAFTFKRNKIYVQMSLFFPSRSGGGGNNPATSKGANATDRDREDMISYRSIKFHIARDDPSESPERIATELVRWGLVHPDDWRSMRYWLEVSVRPLMKSPHAYTLDMVPNSVNEWEVPAAVLRPASCATSSWEESAARAPNQQQQQQQPQPPQPAAMPEETAKASTEALPPAAPSNTPAAGEASAPARQAAAPPARRQPSPQAATHKGPDSASDGGASERPEED